MSTFGMRRLSVIATPHARALRGSLRLGWLAPLVLAFCPLDAAQAQEPPLQPGEAFVTRFSGTATVDGQIVINPDGTVGSIVDLRSPRQPPTGLHWVDEPQRSPVTAGQVGQVFGVALDDANPPNIFLASTAAFGLHRTADNSAWMPGMWGPGGPGAIYVLDRNAGYQPRLLARITLNGRPNTGAGLGNIAYDRINKQLFVTDLETGMIHRLRARDGADGGFFDHGGQGRSGFFDAATNQQASLPPIPLNPASRARINDCPAGRFETSPDCWNVADSGRRVWGVGVYRHPASGEVRLYYAVWSSPAFGAAGWNQTTDEDKRNSIWSVRLGPDGNFDPSGVRREFLLPDFFQKQGDIARAGFSQPVSDISFPECGGSAVMLLAERGGLRNLGLASTTPFATPHEARALRYELYQDGIWRPVGRYDVGFYNREKDGEPFMRANCAGGIAFGPGYTDASIANRERPDKFVWITADSLCSPDSPCNLPGVTPQNAAARPPAQTSSQPVAEITENPLGDDSEVHGLQGLAETSFDEMAPSNAFQPYPSDGSEPYPPSGPVLAYLIDTDINVDPNGTLIPDELTRNDATKIGDIAIYQVCAQAAVVTLPLPLPPPAVLIIEEGHPSDISHARYASHGRALSHFRWASHWPAMSHHRYNSWHERRRSVIHETLRSREHNLWISVVHDVRPSWVHDRRRSINHDPVRSRLHDQRRSAVHDLRRSSEHDVRLSRGGHTPAGSHVVALSQVRHVPQGSHLSLLSLRGHTRDKSNTATALRSNQHVTALSRRGHTPPGSHNANLSKARTHSANLSRVRTHTPAGSHNTTASKRQAHTPPGSHSKAASRPARVHSAAASRGPTHTTAASSARTRVHSAVASRGPRVTRTPQVLRRAPVVRQPAVRQPVVRQPPPVIRRR